MENTNLAISFALDTDSYKWSHSEQLPAGVQFASSYCSARSDKEYRASIFFGLQAELRNIVANPLTREQVEEARDIAMAHSGTFPYEQFMRIVNEHGGLPPVSISALPEGTLVPNHVPYYQVRNTAPGFAELGQFMETRLLRAVWYATAVATLSWHIKQDLRAFLNRTCDDPESAVKFMLHDFGARGASSVQTAALGGMAHLVNFLGTDTVPALVAAHRYYDETAAGFSIPAMEHFTVTSWGRDREADAYSNMIDKFGGEGRVYACVSDAYDIYNAVDNIWGKQLKEKVLSKGGRVVIRPDSGDPVSVVLYCVKSLAASFGVNVNSKGFKVLHPSVRVIQGDGVNRDSIIAILRALELHGFSAENVAFGMGGALLQATNRDVLGHAQKASAVTNGREAWTGIMKDPITASSKKSLKGHLAVVRNESGILEVIQSSELGARENILRTVYEDGKLFNEQTFSEVRAAAEAGAELAKRFAQPYAHNTDLIVL
ncbi:nicotinamide phosphoribosyl transferase [Burkholderia phage BcepSaruman]|uniref:Nicotinamide phosphoribosyltransferase n=1 Tax=Burkholderia phage BcepSaruman TaxID=2530032 RepID=A0A4D5ZDA6_9CAUD|nr:nicotinamide phosphoribosyl transferase [Burkholderia phage BcepSaruman]QBX06526.1 nicotinate phosphoribosyltransferase [Burkholderia phage BcepSaruman]